MRLALYRGPVVIEEAAIRFGDPQGVRGPAERRHIVGDEGLRAIAHVIQAEIRAGDHGPPDEVCINDGVAELVRGGAEAANRNEKAAKPLVRGQHHVEVAAEAYSPKLPLLSWAKTASLPRPSVMASIALTVVEPGTSSQAPLLFALYSCSEPLP